MEKKAKPEKVPYLLGILAWLIPGAGHWYLGKRDRAVVMFVVICGTFVMGVMLGGIEIVGLQNTKAGPGEAMLIYAQLFCGLPTVIGALAQDPNIPMGNGRGVDLGQLYAGVAGLLNLLCIVDALLRDHRQVAGASDRQEKGTTKGVSERPKKP